MSQGRLPTRSLGPEGRYGLLRPIGVTRAGTFWHGLDNVTDEAITVEFLRSTPPDDPTDADLLLKGMDALLELPLHPHVLRTRGWHTPLRPDRRIENIFGRSHRVFQDQWIVLHDDVDGWFARDRSWLLSDRSVTKALAVAIGAAEGLMALHDVGRTHGGLGLETVLVDRERGAVLVDVGVRPVGSSSIAGRGPAGDVADLVRMVHELIPGAGLPDDLDRAQDLEQVLTCLRDLRSRPDAIIRKHELVAANEHPAPVKTQGPGERGTSGPGTIEPEAARGEGRAPHRARPARRPTPRAPSGPPPDHRGPTPGPGRGPGRHARIVGASIVALAVLAIALVTVADLVAPTTDGETAAGPASLQGARTDPSPIDARGPGTGLVAVPDVAGMSASEAREILLSADLELARLVPAPGPPGEVVGSSPLAGHIVAPGEGVVVMVGAEPDRLGDALDPMVRSLDGST